MAPKKKTKNAHSSHVSGKSKSGSGEGKSVKSSGLEFIRESNTGYYYGGDPDSDAYLYRPLTARITKDLTPITQERMQNIAWILYDQNLTAHRILEMTKDFVIGEGITVTATNPKVLEILEEFWFDPVNFMPLKQHTKVLELGLYGEQFYPVDVNEKNGHVRLGYLDPCQVNRVETDENNVEIPTKVHIKGVRKPLKIIQPNKKTGRLEGECFFFAINKVANSTRGRSDLLTLADWIDGYDTFLFNRLERSRIMNVFFWDVTLEGQGKEGISEWLDGTPLPRPGSIRAHNEKVKWEAIVPKLESSDASEEAKLMRAHIAMGSGIPQHWLGGGEGITRATALEMGTPAYKRFKTRQLYVKFMFSYILKFVLDQAFIHGTLDPKLEKDKENLQFSLIFPKLEEKAMDTVASAISSVTSSLSLASEHEWISDEEARMVYRHMISLLGIDMPKEQKKKVEETAHDKQFQEEIKKLQSEN